MANKQFKYEKITTSILELVKSGTLAPGDSLPSIRQLSKQQHTSVSTVLKAYHILEDLGIIAAKPKSGFIVLPNATSERAQPAPITLPLTAHAVTASEWTHALFKNLPNEENLSYRGPFPNILNSDIINRTLASSIRKKPLVSQYFMHPQGYEPLRKEIVKRGIQRGMHTTPENIVITSGGGEALFLALRAVTKPGDTVAIESPCYFGLLYMLEVLQLNVIEVKTDIKTGISLNTLEEIFKKGMVQACVFTANFQLPLGFKMPVECKQALAALGTKYKIPLIENDVLGECGYTDDPATPVKAFDKSGMVIYCSSFSKTIASGYRVGWIDPGIYAHEKVMSLRTIAMTTASPTQMAVSEYLRTGLYKRHLQKYRQLLLSQQIRTRQAIYDILPETIKVSKPKGGIALWLELPSHMDSVAICHKAAKEGIIYTPGSAFSTDNKYKNYMRVNAGTDSGQISNDITILNDIIKEYH